ncbi:MAG TPA: DegT/DnrJ/EryC1/StrS aminotransferase family protein [Burkholderiales bacterium]|nr:DegT/DnrJ/EryC1/StrS aminotransferase family protein [Burkholderiales bacterium]
MTPYLPFARPEIDEQTIAAVGDVLRSGWITSGPQVLRFEQALSARFGGRPVRAFTSATAALEVALDLAGVGPGDEVVVPAMTFVASANVVLRAGARAVLVDVDLDSRNTDAARIEAALTPRTRAIMPVHFAGLPVDLAPVYALAKRRGLRVIEDAAHAMGAAYGERAIGAQGDLVAFSFHPNKNITSIEGGALSFADPAEVERAERLRFHGIRKLAGAEIEVEEPGGKFNLPDVCATIGLAQLAHLERFNARRRELARRYFEHLRGLEHVRLPAADRPGHSWHLFAPLVDFQKAGTTRGAFIEAMHARGIGVGVHYPALHLFAAYRRLGYRPGDFPNAEMIGARTVTLPLFTRMSDADLHKVCSAMTDILREESNGRA